MAVMIYKCINNLEPQYLSEIFSSCSTVNKYALRSSTQNNILINDMELIIIKELLRKLEPYCGIICL